MDVLPEIEDGEGDIQLNPEELKIDTYRSGGAGGQHVNKTDSAVRITHIPTGIVVQCQSERSQISNRASAEKILKAKLLDLRRQEQEKELASLRGDQQEIAWGSQIRSYVFHPYTMVKDHRTKYETGNVQASWTEILPLYGGLAEGPGCRSQSYCGGGGGSVAKVRRRSIRDGDGRLAFGSFSGDGNILEEENAVEIEKIQWLDKPAEKELPQVARQLRRDIINMIWQANSGHPGGSLSAADILTCLYFQEMNLDPAAPDWAERDRFVLSKGHAAPVLYSALARRGYFDPAELLTLRRLGSRLQGHPHYGALPGVEMSTGSLGQGGAAAVGMALAAKLDKKNYRVYTLWGDGELEEGLVWESAMAAAHISWIIFAVSWIGTAFRSTGKLPMS